MKQGITQEIIDTLKINGYTVYAGKDKDGSTTDKTSGYVFAISPKNNVLYVQEDYFGGYYVSLQYVPSRKNGSGCHDNTIENAWTVTPEFMQKSENGCLQFARKLGAELYKTPEQWKNKYWHELVEL